MVGYEYSQDEWAISCMVLITYYYVIHHSALITTIAKDNVLHYYNSDFLHILRQVEFKV